VAAGHHPDCERAVSGGMHQNAVPQIAGSNHPPIEYDSCEQADVPERSVLGCEKNSRQPKRRRCVSAKGHALKIVWVDQPAHQPSSPEEFFENGHRNNADTDTKEKEDGVVSRGWRRIAGRVSHNAIVEKNEVTPVRRKDVGTHPDHEDGQTQEDAGKRFRRAGPQHRNRDGKDGCNRDDEAQRSGNRCYRLERQQCDEYRERENVGDGSVLPGQQTLIVARMGFWLGSDAECESEAAGPVLIPFRNGR